MALATVVVNLTKQGMGDVFVDGVAVKHCKGVEIKSEAGKPPVVTLHLLAQSVVALLDGADVEQQRELTPEDVARIFNVPLSMLRAESVNECQTPR